MKSKEEIEQLASKRFIIKQFIGEDDYNRSETIAARCGYKEGYTQCQEDNDWTKNCKCESSIGQTWCCNQCGLPYPTRKSDNKYTEEDLRQAIERTYRYVDNEGWSLDYIKEDIIQSLNKQD